MDLKKRLLVLCLWALLDYVVSSCNEKIFVKPGQEVELTSTNYPSNFPHNQNCFFDLSTEYRSGETLHLFALDVSLSCDDNETSLQVFDEFIAKPRYLGKICSGGQTKFISPKERLHIVFRSGKEGTTTGRGFKLNVVSSPDFKHCYYQQAKVLPVLPEIQHITSPYFPFEVAANVHCRWLLKAPHGHRVHLDVQTADMKGSNDCFNFGLYVFDGKTTYDDEKVATVCSNNIQSFSSSGNYLMVVFSSGPHVLHSGGGVRLAYYSSLSDPEAVEKDTSLLFILVGLLLGVASLTIIMIVLRFFILPARRQAKARRYRPTAICSSGSSAAIATISLPTDPPPPYQAQEQNSRRQKRKGLWASSCCFRSGKENRQRSLERSGRVLNNSLHFDSANGEGAGSNQYTSSRFLTPWNGNSQNVNEYLSHSGVRASNLNDYQELPAHAQIRTGSDIEMTDDVASVRISSGQTLRYLSFDSGYHDVTADEDNILRNISEAGTDNEHNKIKSAYERTSARVIDIPLEITEDACVPQNSADNGRDVLRSNVDESGYEIPSVHNRHDYDRPNIENDEESEGIYHSLQFHSDST